MRYTSTRADLDMAFSDVVQSGLASDGGLYLPQSFPKLSRADIQRLANGSYGQTLEAVGALFGSGQLKDNDWARIAETALAQFRHPAIAPLNQLGPNHWLLELYHGPTLSFKDYGLQPLSALLNTLAAEEGRPLFIIGATSGDTGSAAIEAFRGKKNTRIVIMHPKGRVSEVQRRQMTCVGDDNVLNIALDGSFDDCQRIVKSILAERRTNNAEAVLSVNSINWGRLLFQTVYYVHLGARLAQLGKPLAISVPSGNFGNALSAIIAAHMGIPIAKVIVATNANDALATIFNEGEVKRGTVRETLSPAMDIQIPSNLERLLYLLNDRDAERTGVQMSKMADSGYLSLPEHWKDKLPVDLQAISVDDSLTLETIRKTYRETDRIIDPHTAVALAAAEQADIADDMTLMSVATAHPAKFPDAVESALGFPPPVPNALQGVLHMPERYETCKADVDAVMALLQR